MTAIIIISYLFLGFAVYFLLGKRYDLICGVSEDPADLFMLIATMVFWPLIVIGWELRFIGRKYID